MAEKVCPRTAMVVSWEVRVLCSYRSQDAVLDGQTVTHPTKAFSNGRTQCTLFEMRDRGHAAQTGDAMIKTKKAIICALAVLLVAFIGR